MRAMTYLQSLILGALQGLTELFPVSSLGHSVILPSLLRWKIDQSSESFVTFIIATHLTTAVVLFGFFWRDWVRLIRGFFRSLRDRRISNEDRDAKLMWLLIVATIPAGILGLLFEETLKHLFAEPRLVALVLIANGIMLWTAEKLRQKHTPTSQKTDLALDTHVSRLTFGQALKVGVLQCLALLPGFSRTGSTITGGLLVDLTHEEAARFSFLLATPIIGAAAFLKLLELHVSEVQWGPLLVGVVSAALFAFLAVHFLTRFFKQHSLTTFAWYCVIAGSLFSLYFCVWPPV